MAALTAGRKCVVRLLFYTPLIILIIEHTLGAFYWNAVMLKPPTNTNEQEGQRLAAARQQESSTHPIPLPILTKSDTEITCTGSFPLTLVQDVRGPPFRQQSQGIPRIIHQTSKSRCLTQRFAQATDQWRELKGWSYYFHDDAAVQRLMEHYYQEFPLLQDIVENCILYGTLKSDLWRYLVLWIYGGIYVDLDAVPVEFTVEMLDGQQDAFFVVEQYHMLSQYFIAVTPKHPLMWYAIQHSLGNLWHAADTGQIPAAFYTGPHALHQAYIQFRRDGGEMVEGAKPGKKPVWAGHFVGTHNRSVTIVGVAENQNQYIDRDVIGSVKGNEYKKLGMTLHQMDRKHATGKSCLSAILDRANGKTRV